MEHRRLPPQFSYVQLLGETGFGASILAQRRDTGVGVAVKDVNTQTLTELGRVKLEQNIERIRSLHHPNVNPYYETYTTETDHFYITSDYLPQGSLRDEIAARKYDNSPFPEERIWAIISQILQSLAYLHARMKANAPDAGCIIHGNLKPSNILLCDDGPLRVTDYAIRPSSSNRVFSTTTNDYTVCYKAPEVLMHKPCDEKQDIWSLGCILLEMCSLSYPALIKSGVPLEDNFREEPDCIIPQKYSNTIRIFLDHTLVLDPSKRLSAAELLMFPIITESLQKLSFKYAPEDDLRRSSNIFVYKESEQRQTEMVESLPMVPVAPLDDNYVGTPFLGRAPPPLVATTKEYVLAENSTLLHVSASKGDVDGIRTYISMAKAKNDDGLTALMVAAQFNQPESCRELLNYECYLRDDYATTALMIAATEGHIDCVRVLMTREAGFMRPDRACAYSLAMAKGHIHVANLLKPIEDVWRDDKGNTALILAAMAGNLKQVTDNLDKVRFTNAQGKTALMYASEGNHVDIVKILTPDESGIHKLGTNNCIGATALMLASSAGHTHVAEILAHYEAGKVKHNGWTALMFAAQNGHDEIIPYLIDKEARRQLVDGWTALMFSAKGNFIKCMDRLIEFEAGLTMNQGMTALIFAIEKGNEEAIKKLIPYEGKILVGNGHKPSEYAKTLHIRNLLPL